MKIPEINRDGRLSSRLLVILLVGFDKVLDKESQLYLRLLARLVDKAFSEYRLVRECLLEEIKTKDKLYYRFEIVNHLENCVSAISRASKIFDKLANGIIIVKKNKPTKTIKKNLDIYNLISTNTKKKIVKNSVSKVRNRVEHIDEDIYLNKFKDRLFLDVSDDYKDIRINGKSAPLKDLASMIVNYHQLMLEVFGGLPKRMGNGKYYYDETSKR